MAHRSEHIEHEHAHHIVSPVVYVVIFAALMVLTAVTVGVAFVHLGDPWNDVVALTVAVTKATLVVLFFMHVKYGTRMTKLTVVAAIVWLLLLVVITGADYWARSWSALVGR